MEKDWAKFRAPFSSGFGKETVGKVGSGECCSGTEEKGGNPKA